MSRPTPGERPTSRSRPARLCRTLAAVAIALSCACTPSRPVQRPPEAPGRSLNVEVPAEGEGDVASVVLAAHNAERARRRLPPVSLDPLLTAAAQAHADDMARRGRMSHRGRDGSSPFVRIERAGYDFRAAAENVAFGFDRVDAVMDGWMRSPGHRRNILGPTTEIGVGRAVAPAGATYWCVTFGTPRAAVSRATPPPSAILR